MTHWKPDTQLTLSDIPETFNVADFCQQVKKGVLRLLWFDFATNSSATYQENFKAAIEKTRKEWNSEIAFPEIFYFNYSKYTGWPVFAEI